MAMVPNTKPSNVSVLREFRVLILGGQEICRLIWENSNSFGVAAALVNSFDSALKYTDPELSDADVNKYVESARVCVARVASIVENNGREMLSVLAYKHRNIKDPRWDKWFKFFETAQVYPDLAFAYHALKELIVTPKSDFELMSAEERKVHNAKQLHDSNLVATRERRRLARQKRHADQAVVREKELARQMELRTLKPEGKAGAESNLSGTGTSKKSLHKKRQTARRAHV
jgi:hypothetical protein